MPGGSSTARKSRVVDRQQHQTARPAASRSKLPKNPEDIRKMKEYKLAARRWTSTIVALPILMYTSYMLYERVYGDKSPRRLVEQQQQQEKQSSASS